MKRSLDWAAEVGDRLTERVSSDPFGWRNDIARALRAAYRRGKRDEREACCARLESHDGTMMLGQQFARIIRARKGEA